LFYSDNNTPPPFGAPGLSESFISELDDTNNDDPADVEMAPFNLLIDKTITSHANPADINL